MKRARRRSMLRRLRLLARLVCDPTGRHHLRERDSTIGATFVSLTVSEKEMMTVGGAETPHLEQTTPIVTARSRSADERSFQTPGRQCSELIVVVPRR